MRLAVGFIAAQRLFWLVANMRHRVFWLVASVQHKVCWLWYSMEHKGCWLWACMGLHAAQGLMAGG